MSDQDDSRRRERLEALATLADIPVSAIRSVDRLEVKPSQVLVVQAEHKLSKQEIENIRETMETAFPGCRCAVFDRGLTLLAVDNADPAKV